jgi:hypothetical protein
MMFNVDDKSAVNAVEAWFKKHCDGTWEHHLGMTIETTDNPGWVLTFKQLAISKHALADVIGELLREVDAQVGTDRTSVRVFAPSLQQVLVAAAVLIERSCVGLVSPAGQGSEDHLSPSDGGQEGGK